MIVTVRNMNLKAFNKYKEINHIEDSKSASQCYLQFKDFSLAEGSLDVAVAEAVRPGQAPLRGLHVIVLLVHLI